MTFSNLRDLVDRINNDLGSFCLKFQKKKKELFNKKRMNSKNKLFVLADDDRDWSINEGGGTELQYHLFFRNNTVGYGLGFNTQYVPFANDFSSVEYMRPYANSYLAQKDIQYRLQKNSFQFLSESKNELEYLKDNIYILIGKQNNVNKKGNQFKLDDSFYSQMIDDIKGVLFDSYVKIVKERNQHLNYSVTMEKHKSLLKYKKQIILQGPPGTGKTRMAKMIAQDLINLKLDDELIFNLLKKNIEIKSPTETKSYKILDLDKEIKKIKLQRESQTTEDVDFNDVIEAFDNKSWESKIENPKPRLAASLAKHLYEKLLNDSEQLSIVQFHPSYTYEDFVRGISVETKNTSVQYTVNNRVLAELANTAAINPENDYVLIIDEINRANLPSVFGELIYALEYRGKKVESMYKLKDKGRELILPPNLFIIGTMNTADRSVGHIDYAIRRRFAFVDVSPKDLSDDTSINFDLQLFQNVQKLFTIDNYNTKSDFISDEFEPKDVALGHSYFIDKTDEGGTMDIRLEYEIKPILREYVKDGILKEKASHEIEKLKSNLHASS